MRGQERKDLTVKKFLLETRGYRVHVASTEREVLLGSQQGCHDAKLLVCNAGEFSNASLQWMQAAVRHATLVVIEKEDGSPMVFLERIRVNVLRLRTAA